MPIGERSVVHEAASVVGVITRAPLATGAAQQQPEADPQLEPVGERQVRTVRRRGGEDEPVRAGRPDGRQCVVHGGLFRVKGDQGDARAGRVAKARRAEASTAEEPRWIADTRSAGVGTDAGRRLDRVLLGGGQPAVGAVAPNDEVTGAIPQNGERRTGSKPGFIMCIIGDLLSCMWTRRATIARPRLGRQANSQIRRTTGVSRHHLLRIRGRGTRPACGDVRESSGSVSR